MDDEPLSDEPFVGLKLMSAPEGGEMKLTFRRTLCGVEALLLLL